jgi:hypothetical protein
VISTVLVSLLIFGSTVNGAVAASNESVAPTPVKSESHQVKKYLSVSTTADQIMISPGTQYISNSYKLLDENGFKLYEGSDPQIVRKGLEPDRFYTYYLQTGYNQVLDGGVVSITAKTKPLMGEDKGITSVVQTNKEITLTWVSPEDQTEFEIFRDGKLIGKTKEHSFKDSKIEANHEYEYSVQFETVEQAKDEQGADIAVKIEHKYNIGVKSDVKLPSPIYTFDPANADYVHLRFMTFIGYPEVDDPNDLNPFDCAYKFDGDGRGFSYSAGDNHSTNANYRTLQTVDLNFPNKTYSYYENVGTTERYCWSGSTKVNVTTGRASMDNMYVSNFVWGSSSVSFTMTDTAGNPLATVAPTIDAVLKFTVYQGTGQVTGTTTLNIQHDGFPWYEVYRKDGALSYKTIYTHDAQAAGQTALSLAAPMEFESTVTK